MGAPARREPRALTPRAVSARSVGGVRRGGWDCAGARRSRPAPGAFHSPGGGAGRGGRGRAGVVRPASGPGPAPPFREGGARAGAGPQPAASPGAAGRLGRSGLPRSGAARAGGQAGPGRPAAGPGRRRSLSVRPSVRPAPSMPQAGSASAPGAVPDDVRSLLADLETFIAETLRGENLSKKAKEKRESLIKKIKDVKSAYPQDFQDKVDVEDGDEYDDPFPGPPDSLSQTSDRCEKDDEVPSDGNQFPPIAAQDLPFVLKAGYLEKRRKDHSFLGFEWQKRWCALSKTVFYYYGSDKDKQQKGEFAIDGYNVRMNNTLRKDAKKDCCFEISAPDKRIYQFTAATPRDAEEWVHQLKFVLQDLESDVIPEDDDERGELYDDVDPVASITSPPTNGQLSDDEIYEVLPEDEDDPAYKKMEESKPMSQEVTQTPADKSTDYANFYQGLWDCTGAVPDELSFKRGDVIYILSKDYNRFGWWVGEMKGTIGLVPKAYIMEMYDI